MNDRPSKKSKQLGTRKPPVSGPLPASEPRLASGPRPTTDPRHRTLKTVSIASTALFFAVLLVFNIVFDRLLGDRLKWDWTAGQMYSIGPVSQEILGQLDQPVVITGLFSEDQAANFGMTSIVPMLDEYRVAGKGMLTVRYIDPDKTPAVLKEVDPTGYLGAKQGDFVVTSASTGKGKVVGYDAIFQTEVDYQTYSTHLTGVTAEQSLTGAIKHVLSAQTPTVYFTTGHDELDYKTKYASLTGLLQNNNFDVKPLDLFSGAPVPADAAVVILADPKKDLTAGEALAVTDYLEQGGSLMVVTSFHNTSFDQLNAVLSDFDIALSNDRVREGDPNHRLNDDPYILRAVAPAGKLTQETLDGYTIADNVRAINRLSSGKSYVTVEPVLTTSGAGIIETQGDPATSSPESTQTIALLSEHTGFVDGSTVTDPTRVLVLGSSTLFADELLTVYGNTIFNAGLFFYGVQWLAGSDAIDPLYIEAKMPPTYAITSGSTTINAMVAVLVMGLLPLLALALAWRVYRRRKNL